MMFNDGIEMTYNGETNGQSGLIMGSDDQCLETACLLTEHDKNKQFHHDR